MSTFIIENIQPEERIDLLEIERQGEFYIS